MDKIKINNQIILMRKHVKQAKIHAINKLVKQIKLLQNRQGNEAQVQKAKRKADRYLEEVNLLKKMKPDFVSKQALSKAKDWKDVLVQSSTIEDRSLAILANYESIQTEVEKFHSANPNLVSKIPDLVKEWEQKSKFPKLPDFRKGKHENPFLKNSLSNNLITLTDRAVSNPGKKNEDLKETEKSFLTVNEHPLIKGMNISPQKKTVEEKGGVCDVQELPSTQESGTITEINSQDEDCNNDSFDSEIEDESLSEFEKHEAETKKLFNNKSIFQSLNEKNESPSDVHNKKLPPGQEIESEVSDKLSSKPSNIIQNSQQNSTIPSSELPAENSSKTIAVLNLEDLEGLDEIPIQRDTEEETHQEENSENDSSEVSSDPFFLKPEEYADIAVKKQLELPKESKNTFLSRQQDRKGMNRYERRNGRPKKYPLEHETDLNFKQKNFTKSKFQSKPFDKHKFEGKSFNPGSQNIFKKEERSRFLDFKQQSSLDKSNKLPLKKKGDASYAERKYNHKKNITDQPLHPSWEAKRKQKELSQTPFQGKRLVFED